MHSSPPDNKHTEWHPWLRAADARKAILPSVLCNRHGEFRKLQITVQTDTDTDTLITRLDIQIQLGQEQSLPSLVQQTKSGLVRI